MKKSEELMSIVEKFVAEAKNMSVAISIVHGEDLLCAVGDNYPLKAFDHFRETLAKAEVMIKDKEKSKPKHPSIESLEDLLKKFETRYAENEAGIKEIDDFHARVVSEAHDKNIPICFMAQCKDDIKESTLHLCANISDECLVVLAERVEKEMKRRMETGNKVVGKGIGELFEMLFGTPGKKN